jgi:hypothetical protein
MKEICSEAPKKGDKRELAEGVHPKKCIDNSDCGLKNESAGKCQCGLSPDGQAYCSLSEADPELS